MSKLIDKMYCHTSLVMDWSPCEVHFIKGNWYDRVLIDKLPDLLGTEEEEEEEEIRYSQQEAKERVEIKRELKRKGILFNNKDSTEK